MDGITTLNKVVSLFLVGGLFLAFTTISLVIGLGVPAWVHEVNQQNAGAIVFWGTLPLLCLAAVFGAAAQGLAGMLVRNHIKRLLANPPWWFGLFRQSEFRKEVEFWNHEFKREIENSRFQDMVTLPHVPESDTDPSAKAVHAERKAALQNGQCHHPLMPTLARAIFFRKVDEHTANWVLQHYSAFYLASDAAMVLLLFIPWTVGYLNYCSIFKTHFKEMMAVVLIQLFLIYALLGLAVLRYLYTARSVAREATLLIAEENRPVKSSR